MASLPNSGISSRKSTPFAARLISPGFGVTPPPTREVTVQVWCGDLKGRLVIKYLSSFKSPATLYILDIVRQSSKLISGMIPGIRLAIMVLPDPGGPESSRLCCPHTAISAARLAASCPDTSLKSSTYSAEDPLSSSSDIPCSTSISLTSRIYSISSFKVSTPSTFIPPTTAPSLAFPLGTITISIPASLAAIHIGSTPLIRFTLPSKPSSPTISMFSNFSCGNISDAARHAIAMGRSNAVPAFLTSAGERFTVICFGRKAKLEFLSAVLTLSLASFTSEAR